jgi:hypothetical protein
VADLNQVIKAAAVSPLYVPLLAHGGLGPDDRVLPLSCFAVTDAWTPSRLAGGTRYRRYRLASASTLAGAGYPVWPTEIFDGDVADPRNEVHYDVIVASGSELRLAELAGSRSERASARERLAPAFRAVFASFGEAIELPVEP